MPTHYLQRRQFLAAGAGGALAGCEVWQDPMSTAHIQGGFIGVSVERGHRLRGSQTSVSPSVTHRTGVMVLGGGVAGLAAARALRLRGVDDFALLELEDAAGGNARGGVVGGIACPLGAHYLPVPGDDAPQVQDLLEELGLRRRVAGRWVYDERHLCHSPQERLFFDGHWQDGLLPVQSVDSQTLMQYRRFAEVVEQAQRASRWTLPVRQVPNRPLAPEQRALAAITFEAFLNRQGLDDVHLRWYLDYCCRDDYGAGLSTVSAWAGIHYFASRHGFRAPGAPSDDAVGAGVLTWPEGNGWLTRHLAAPLGDRLRTGHVVMRVAQDRHGVQVDSFNIATQTNERWHAEQVIVALPIFIAARVVQNAPDFLRAAAHRVQYAPWLVANLHLAQPLRDRPGAAPSWDNVIYDEHVTGGLGYVNAMHQNLQPVPGATVLTHYRAWGDAGGGARGRQLVLEQPWAHWRDTVLQEMIRAHPDLTAKVTRMDITRYGHAMAMPLPDAEGRVGCVSAIDGRMRYAHSDWAGYSVFEEAFCSGHAAGDTLARSLRVRSST